MPAKSSGTPSKPKKPLPAKAINGTAGRMRGSTGLDPQPLRAYDPVAKTADIVPRTTGGNSGGSIANTMGPGGAGTGSYGAGTGGGYESGGAMPNGYASGNYNAAFYENPDALSQDFLAGMGVANPQFTNEFAPTVDALQLLVSVLGADQPGELLSPAGQANQMNDLMSQVLTPGGEALDPASIMAALANADPNSFTGQLLAQMTPDQITDIAVHLLSAAGGNPFQAQGMRAALEQQGRDYNIDYAKGGQGMASRSYWQGLQSGQFGPYFGGG